MRWQLVDFQAILVPSEVVKQTQVTLRSI